MDYMPTTLRDAQNPVQGALRGVQEAMTTPQMAPQDSAVGMSSMGGLRAMQWSPNVPDPLNNPAVVKQMIGGLQDPDVKWYAYMAGALAPTKSGSFSESLSNAMQQYANTRMEEMKLQAQYMPMLANQLLAAQQARYAQMAKQQELNKQWNDTIVANLRPLLFGKDVRQNGVDPNLARATIMDLARKQIVPMDLASVYIEGIPDDPRAAFEYINRRSQGLLNAETGYNVAVPPTENVVAGGRTVPVTGGRPSAGTGPQLPPGGPVIPHTPEPAPNSMVMGDTGPVTLAPQVGMAAEANSPQAAQIAAATAPAGQPPIVYSGGQATPGAPRAPAAPPSAAVAPTTGPSPTAANPSASGPAGAFSSAAQLPSIPPASATRPPNAAPPDTEQTPGVSFENAKGEPVAVKQGLVPRVDQSRFTMGMGPGKQNPMEVKKYSDDISSFQKSNEALADTVAAQRDQILRMQQVAELVKQVQTGATAEVRRKVASVAKDLAVLTGWSDESAGKFANRVAGGDLAALQQLEKMSISGALSAFGAERPPGTRMTQAEFLQIRDAVQGPKMDAASIEGLRSKMLEYHRRESANLALRSLFASTPGADVSQYENFWNNMSRELGFVNMAPRSDAVKTKSGKWAVPVRDANGAVTGFRYLEGK